MDGSDRATHRRNFSRAKCQALLSTASPVPFRAWDHFAGCALVAERWLELNVRPQTKTDSMLIAPS